MGEKQNQRFQLSFNSSLKVDFQGSRVTSDGGLILVRELDERLGLGELLVVYEPSTPVMPFSRSGVSKGGFLSSDASNRTVAGFRAILAASRSAVIGTLSARE